MQNGVREFVAQIGPQMLAHPGKDEKIVPAATDPRFGNEVGPAGRQFWITGGHVLFVDFFRVEQKHLHHARTGRQLEFFLDLIGKGFEFAKERVGRVDFKVGGNGKRAESLEVFPRTFWGSRGGCAGLCDVVFRLGAEGFATGRGDEGKKARGNRSGMTAREAAGIARVYRPSGGTVYTGSCHARGRPVRLFFAAFARVAWTSAAHHTFQFRLSFGGTPRYAINALNRSVRETTGE